MSDKPGKKKNRTRNRDFKIKMWRFRRRRLLTVQQLVPIFTVILVVNGIFSKFMKIEEINRLVVRDRNGAIVLNKDVTEHWNKPLRLWNCSNELLIFLHIPKSGGTSLREALKTSLGNKTSFTCNLQHVNTEKVFISQKRKEDCLRMSPSDCASHFDWRTIQGIEEMGIATAPLVMLRNPVDRFISNFYFVKKNVMWKDTKMISQNLSQFLDDHESMMESRCIWHDGQGIASWLAGIHMYRVGHSDLSVLGLDDREKLCQDWSFMLNAAIDNLHKSLWFGILEDGGRSLEMLKFQIGVKLQTEHINVNHKKPSKDDITQDQINRIKALMPVDLYLYEYAKQLHKNRWDSYQMQRNGIEVGKRQKDELSMLPTVIDGCKSTRFELDCPFVTYHYDKLPRNIAPGVDTFCNLLCNAPYVFQTKKHF